MSLFLSRPSGVPTHQPYRINTKSPHARGLEGLWPEFGARGVNALTGQVASTVESIGGAPIANVGTAFGQVPRIYRGGDDWDTGYHGGSWAGSYTPINRNGNTHGTMTAWVWMQGDGDSGWASEWQAVNGAGCTITFNDTSGNGSIGAAWNLYSQQFMGLPLPIRNRWWFVASGIASDGMRLYANSNGVEVTMTVPGMSWTITSPWSGLNVGGPSAGFRRFGGIILDIRRYNFKLTLDQMRQLADPVSRWDLYRV